MASTQSQLGNVALSPRALHSKKSNSKIIQKLKLSQKPSCTSPSSTTTCFHLNHQKPKKANYAAATLPAVELAQRLCVFPAKLALQCCSQIFTEMRINFQVVSKLNSLYFKNHQNFVLGLHSGSPATLRLLLQSELPSPIRFQWIQIRALWPQRGSIHPTKG